MPQCGNAAAQLRGLAHVRTAYEAFCSCPNLSETIVPHGETSTRRLRGGHFDSHRRLSRIHPRSNGLERNHPTL